MPSFIYLGGTEFDGTELPAKVKLFGISFVEGVAKPVTPADFKTSIAYEHAVKKLATHSQFQTLVDDVQEVIAEPKKTWSRKPKPKIDAIDVEPSEIQDAAE